MNACDNLPSMFYASGKCPSILQKVGTGAGKTAVNFS